MNQQVRKAFIAMGYREVGEPNSGKWAKPIGWMVLTLEEDRYEATLWFQSGSSDERCRWQTKKLFEPTVQHMPALDYETALQQVKGAEADLLRQWPGNHWNTRFEFLTQEQKTLDMVGHLT